MTPPLISARYSREGENPEPMHMNSTPRRKGAKSAKEILFSVLTWRLPWRLCALAVQLLDSRLRGNMEGATP